MENKVMRFEKGESITTETIMDILEGESGVNFDGYNQYTVAHDIEIIIRKSE